MSDDLIEIYNDLKNIFTNDNIELNKKFVKINLENKDESLYIKELDTIEKKWANKNYSFVEINNTIMIMDYNEGRSFLKTQTFKKTKEININYICLFDYLFISSQMSAKPYFIGSTGILLLW